MIIAEPASSGRIIDIEDRTRFDPSCAGQQRGEIDRGGNVALLGGARERRGIALSGLSDGLEPLSDRAVRHDARYRLSS